MKLFSNTITCFKYLIFFLEFDPILFEQMFLKFENILKDDFKDEKKVLNKFINCLQFIYLRGEKTETQCLNIDLIQL